jgi:hypothetical protein
VGIGNKLFAIAQQWAGKKWAMAAPAKPKGAADSELNGVSCATASDCWAVGESITSSGATSPLLEQWNGTAWSVPA